MEGVVVPSHHFDRDQLEADDLGELSKPRVHHNVKKHFKGTLILYI